MSQEIRRARIFLAVAACPVAAIVFGSLYAPETDDQRLVGAIAATYHDVTRIHATVRMRNHPIKGERRGTGTPGELWWERPARFRLALRGKQPVTLVRDGDTTWSYREKEQRVLVMTDHGEAPFERALDHLATLADDDLVSVLPLESPGDPFDTLQLRPPSGESGETVEVRFRERDHVLREIETAAHTASAMLLSDVSFDTEIPDGTFTFVAPSGVEEDKVP